MFLPSWINKSMSIWDSDMKTAIVTGASGFVGGAVLRELLNNNYTVYAVIREGREDTLPKSDRCIPVPCDLSEISTLVNKIPIGKASCFYHFAWSGSAGADRANTALQLQNAQWTVECLQVSKTLGCSRFIGAGSIMEQETMAAAYTQGNKPGLGYIYGSGKVVAHAMCKSVATNIGVDLLWAYITNAYGVGEKSPRMVNTTIQKCIRKEPPKFTAGTQNYDFIYIDDVARAFRLIGEKGIPFNDYLIGSGTARPLREFLLDMKKAIAPDLDFIFGDIPFTGINLPLTSFSCSKAEQDTGFRAEISFAEGCKRTCDWWKEIIKADE